MEDYPISFNPHTQTQTHTTHTHTHTHTHRHTQTQIQIQKHIQMHQQTDIYTNETAICEILYRILGQTLQRKNIEEMESCEYMQNVLLSILFSMFDHNFT